MGCCYGHWHGPSCWHYGYPFYGDPFHGSPDVPPGAGRRARRRGSREEDERDDLEEYLRRLEDELRHVRDRLEELEEAGTA